MNDPEISIYLHIPFCQRKCLYCDFCSDVASSEDTFFYYTNALLKEIASKKELFEGRKLSSIYIGGGTPSVMPSHALGNIMDAISAVIDIDDDTEITMEVNPGTVNELKLKDYVAFGINRVSMGVQSMIEDELFALGRIHTADDVKKSFDMLYWSGIDNISMDIMTSIPHQTVESLMKTIDEIDILHPKHISAYALSIEKGTPFYEKYLYGTLQLPSEEESYAIYKTAQAYLDQKGYKRYEISNYALEVTYAPRDYRCRHNLRYWDRKDYVGLGVSAASKVGDHRFTNTRDLYSYASDPGNVRIEDYELKKTDAMAEFMFLGLRKTEGIRLLDFRDCFDTPIEEVYGKVMKNHVDHKLAVMSGDDEERRFMLTEQGMDVANYVMCDYMF